MKPFSPFRMYSSAIYVIVMVAIASGMLYLLFSERASLGQEATVQTTESTRVTDMIKIARLSRERADLIPRMEAAFQSATNTVAIIEAVEKSAASAGVTLTIRKAETDKKDNNQFLAINAEVQGSWNEVYRFMLELDMFPYKHDTQNMEFVKIGKSESGSDEWSARVDVWVHIMR